MRLQPERMPDAADGRVAEAGCLGHPAGAPMRRAARRAFQRAHNHLLDLLVGDGARRPPAAARRTSPRGAPTQTAFATCRPSRAWRAVGGPPPCCLGLRRTPARCARGGPAPGPVGIGGRGIPIRVVPPYSTAAGLWGVLCACSLLI